MEVNVGGFYLGMAENFLDRTRGSPAIGGCRSCVVSEGVVSEGFYLGLFAQSGEESRVGCPLFARFIWEEVL